MSGNNSARYNLVSINFSEFNLNPAYPANHKFHEKEIEWSLQYDFYLKEKSPEWDTLAVAVGLKLLRSLDDDIIFDFVTETTYRVSAGISYDFKCIIISLLINQTIGHLQGALCMQSPNIHLTNILPQAFNHAKDNIIELKKTLYEKWD